MRMSAARLCSSLQAKTLTDVTNDYCRRLAARFVALGNPNKIQIIKECLVLPFTILSKYYQLSTNTYLTHFRTKTTIDLSINAHKTSSMSGCPQVRPLNEVHIVSKQSTCCLATKYIRERSKHVVIRVFAHKTRRETCICASGHSRAQD